MARPRVSVRGRCAAHRAQGRVCAEWELETAVSWAVLMGYTRSKACADLVCVDGQGRRVTVQL